MIRFEQRVVTTEQIERLMSQDGFNHVQPGNYFMKEAISPSSHLEKLLATVRSALISGGVPEARRLMEEALASHASAATAGDWAKFRDITSWPDAWLVAAIRRDPPDEASLEV